MLLARRNNNQNWLNNWFDDDFFDTALMPRMNATAPAVNVKETAEDYTMEVAVPGLKKEWVRVNIDNEGNLKLAIENKFEHKEENTDGKKSDEKHVHYLRREFSYSNYEQTYVLPDDVDRNKISAKVADGVLTVVIPKEVKDEQKTLKTIEVK